MSKRYSGFAHIDTQIQSVHSAPYHADYMGLSGSRLRTAIGLAAGLCFVAFGYGQADIGGLFIIPSFAEKFPNFVHSAAICGAVVGTWNLGCFTGAFFLIFLSTTLGRKGSIVTGLALEGIGRIIQASSFTPGQYIAGRFVAGVGNGFIASAVPAWHVECIKTHKRGTMLMVSFGVCITAGIALAFWACYAFSFVMPSSASWRLPLAIPILFIVVALVLMLFLPESPRYLILNGREKEALNVLSALNEMPPDHEDIRREYLMIKNAIIYMIQGASMPAIFSMGKSRYAHRVLLAIALQVMQQFTGVNIFIQYLATMFNLFLLFEWRTASLLGACCATVFCIASLLSIFGMDRFWGRRSLTMFGSAGMCICLIVLSVLSYLATSATHHVMAAFLFIFCTFFAVGWQGMSWLWSVELIPLSVRGPANALATAANWLANFVVVFCSPIMLFGITWRTYIIFACTNFAIVPIIYLFYPETGSRSLEEIDMLFQGACEAGKPFFSVVSISKKEPRWYDKDGLPTDSGDGSTTYVMSDMSDMGEKNGNIKAKYIGSDSDGESLRRIASN